MLASRQYQGRITSEHGEHRVQITALVEGAAIDGFIVRRRVSYQVERIVWGSAIVRALLVMGYILRQR